MTFPQPGIRRGRHVLALSITSLAVITPCASAATQVTMFNDAGGASVNVSDTGTAGSFQIELVRGGSTVANGTSFSTFPGRTAYLNLPNAGQLQVGDQLQYVVSGQPTQTFEYDGLPAFNADACTGATTYTGKAAAGSTLTASAITEQGSADAIINDVTLAQSGDSFTAKLANALKTGDRLFLGQVRTSGDATISTYTIKKAAACPAVATPAPVATPGPKVNALPTLTQVLTALQALAGQQTAAFSKLDLATVVNKGAVNVPFSFLVPGKVTFRWLVSGAGTRSGHAAKAKTITLARGAASRTTPGTAKVKLRLSKAGKTRLRHAKKVRITFEAAFTPAGGGAIQMTQKKFTLKKHAKKSKKH